MKRPRRDPDIRLDTAILSVFVRVLFVWIALITAYFTYIGVYWWLPIAVACLLVNSYTYVSTQQSRRRQRELAERRRHLALLRIVAMEYGEDGL